MGRGRLMEAQKQAVIEQVEAHRGQGRRVGEVLGGVGVARSSYYRWKKGQGEKNPRGASSYEITIERKLIDEVKEQNPQYRHRRIQGVLQQRGVYLSASVIYGHLKQRGHRAGSTAGSAVERAPLRGLAEKSDVGQRLDR
jgi:hypothetical protein